MDAEVIVVGGGIVGLWTAYTLASQGVKTILFEQFPYPHTRGSSHGQSRITRTAYAQEMYSAMMPEANRKWKELHAASGKEIFVNTGLLAVYDVIANKESFEAMLKNMEKYEPNYEVLNGEDLNSRYPGIAGKSNQKAIYDGGAGVLRADNCLSALQDLFKERGGILYEREPVVSVNPISEREVAVFTKTKTYRSPSVVLTCGAYINKILETVDLKIPVETTRQLVHYWRVRDGSKYESSDGFPDIMSLKPGGNSMYATPSHEYPGLVKICYHAGPTVEPHQRDKFSSERREEEKRLLEWLKEEINLLFTQIDTNSPAITEVCMYTKSPDSNFILDYHPRFKNIVIGSGFSGHGFKTSPSVGHILANMARGLPSPYPTQPFSLKRFTATSKL